MLRRLEKLNSTKKMLKTLGITIFPLLTLGLCQSTFAATITVTSVVDGSSGPWNYGTNLNAGSNYGVNSQLSPTVFNTSSGLDFSAGNNLQIDYVSGLTSPYGGTPSFTAIGDISYIVNANNYAIYGVAPSKFISSTEYDVYLNELVGTFANSTGTIVGTPFKIGLTRSLIIPVGASQLQLGFNDIYFGDNTGAITVNVTGLQAGTMTAVPEPFSTIGTLIGGTAALRLRRKMKSSNRVRVGGF
jgi:hypothetical protein